MLSLNPIHTINRIKQLEIQFSLKIDSAADFLKGIKDLMIFAFIV